MPSSLCRLALVLRKPSLYSNRILGGIMCQEYFCRQRRWGVEVAKKQHWCCYCWWLVVPVKFSCSFFVVNIPYSITTNHMTWSDVMWSKKSYKTKIKVTTTAIAPTSKSYWRISFIFGLGTQVCYIKYLRCLLFTCNLLYSMSYWLGVQVKIFKIKRTSFKVVRIPLVEYAFHERYFRSRNENRLILRCSHNIVTNVMLYVCVFTYIHMWI